MIVSASGRKVRPAAMARSMFEAAKPAYSPTGGTHTVMCIHGWTSCSSRKSAGTQVNEMSLSTVARIP